MSKKSHLLFEYPSIQFSICCSSFPGGALFLFEAAGENSIIHVGDLRLHAEVTENEFLMKTNIDEVRFDKS